MLITIAASVVCASAAVLPALAEVRRILDERDAASRKLDIPTRRSQVEAKVEVPSRG